MSADQFIICDQCGSSASSEPFPYPLSITDAGGANEDICSARCLIDRALSLFGQEAFQRGERQARKDATPLRRAWWQRGGAR